MTLKPRNINAGHRNRMREKFIRSEIDGFLPHELLEIMLFYPISYKDTNPTAHLLIEKFGSFRNVLAAESSDLCEVDGIGEQTSFFLKALEELGKRALVRNKSDFICLDTHEALAQFAAACVSDEIESCIYMIMLNNSYEHIATIKILDNVFPNQELPKRKILDLAIEKNASMIALVTHRLSTPLRPTKAEIEITFNLLKSIDEYDIKMLEHYVVSGPQLFCYSRVLPALLQCKPKFELFYKNYSSYGDEANV